MPKLVFCENVPAFQYRWTGWKDGKVTYQRIIAPLTVSVTLCDICGSQVVDRRRPRTCSNACTEIYWRRYHAEHRAAQRTQSIRSRYWITYRGEARQRDGHRCVRCGAAESEDAPLEVHHIVPLSSGGTNELENLVTLCAACHKQAHSAAARTLVQHGGKTIEEWL